MTQASQSLRVGLIGTGPIAEWHVRALRLVGFAVTAVASRPGSSRVHDFAARHGIPQAHPDWRGLLSRPDEWDALVIATHPDGTPEILAAALGLGVPILVEKPVAWGSERIKDLLEQAHSRVIVGFNRRFYSTVQRAREEAQNGPPLLVTLALPDAVIPPRLPSADTSYLRPLFDMGSHGFDLLRFVLGELEIHSLKQLRTPSGPLAGFAAILNSKRGDIVQITGNWNTPANYALTLHRPGRRFELLPLEVATVYEGLEVVEPSDDYPVRRYLPRATEHVWLGEVDRREKPGFVAQARVLADLVRGVPANDHVATLADAWAAVRLCEAMAGSIMSA